MLRGRAPAPSHRAAPETRCPLFLVDGAQDGAGMLQPRWEGRGDLSNHTNDFFPPPLVFFFFVILEFIFLLFFLIAKALFIYLMYTAKLGEEGSYLGFFFFF